MLCGKTGVFGQISLLFHEPEHKIAPRKAEPGVAEGRIAVGGAHDGCEHGAFGCVERFGVLSEIKLRGIFDPEGAVSEIDGVEVECKDLLFGVMFFKDTGKFQLFELALNGLFAREMRVFDELL